MTQDNSIARLVMHAVWKNRHLSTRLVRVDVRDGCVILTGRVNSEADKVAAAELAASIPSVRLVINYLTVVRPEMRAESEIAEEVRRILERDRRLVKESIVVAVRRGVVALSGTISSEPDRIRILDIVLGIDGVRCVEDFLTIDVVHRIEDATLARKIRSAIEARLGNRGGCVRTAVAGGRLVLSGYVFTNLLRQIAQEVSQEFPLQIRNEIQVVGRSVDSWTETN